MRELFKEQLENNKVITENTYKKLKTATYFNGDKREIGEVPLFATIKVPSSEPGLVHPLIDFTVTLIVLNEKHFDLFEYDPKEQSIPQLPLLKLKS